MAAIDVLMDLLLNANYVFSVLAIGVGLSGIVLFLRETLKDYRRHTGARLSSGNLDNYSFLDE